jgi:hypothetical protein
MYRIRSGGRLTRDVPTISRLGGSLKTLTAKKLSCYEILSLHLASCMQGFFGLLKGLAAGFNRTFGFCYQLVH